METKDILLIGLPLLTGIIGSYLAYYFTNKSRKDTKSKEEKNANLKNERKLILFLSLGVIILWIASWIFVDYYFSFNKDIYTNRGTFGDKFGFVNSLFSGLALAGIIYSIILQQKELALQRKELSSTRDEFKGQNFQTTFFNLLKTQREIINEFDVNFPVLGTKFNEGLRHASGRKFFYLCKSVLEKILTAFENENYVEYDSDKISEAIEAIHFHHGDTFEGDCRLLELNEKVQPYFTFYKYNIDKNHFDHFKTLKTEEPKIRMTYDRFFGKHGFAIGHYFRHLYHILLFIEKSENEKIQRISEEETELKDELIIEVKLEYYNYAQFLKSQMDTPELFILFYNSFEFAEAKRLLIKYKILDNLHVRQLLRREHNIVQELLLIEEKSES